MAEDPRGPIDWRHLHLWDIQPIRDVLVVLGVFGILYLGYVLSLVTVPLLLALALAYLFEPIVRRLTRLRWMSRQGASATIIAAIIVVVLAPITLGLGVAVVQGVDLGTRFANNVVRLQASVENPDDESLREALPSEGWQTLRDELIELSRPDAIDPEGEDAAGENGDAVGVEPRRQPSRVGVVLADWFERTADWIEENPGLVGRRAVEGGLGAVNAAIRFVGSAGMLAFGAFLTLFFFFFVSVGYPSVLELGRKFIPEKNKGRTLELLGRMDGVIAGFIRGRLVIAAIQSLVFTLAYTAIGVPASLILGVAIGFLSMVPYLALVGLPISIVLLWLEPNTLAFQDTWWWTLGAPIAVYFGGQALDDYVWTPIIQGRETGMDTPTILFASIAGGILGGIYGLLLGIPVAACLKIIISDAIWPRVQAWMRGEVDDPLPFGNADD